VKALYAEYFGEPVKVSGK